MNFLLVGGTGGVGKQLEATLKGDSHTVSITGRSTLNVLDENSIKTLFIDLSKDIDVIVYLPVINRNGLVSKLTASDLDEQLDVNVRGYNLFLVHALNYAKTTGKKATIIYISSIVSVNPVAGAGVYGACKAYCEALTKTAAIEAAKKISDIQIRCFNIRMGYFNAGIISAVPEIVLNQIREAIPMKRLGKVQELARLIEFLGTAPDFMTGSTITIAGGA